MSTVSGPDPATLVHCLRNRSVSDPRVRSGSGSPEGKPSRGGVYVLRVPPLLCSRGHGCP